MSTGAMRVCFGYGTSFRLLRASSAKGLARTKGKAAVLPDRALDKGEIDALVGHLESLYPGFRDEGPVHVLIGSNVRQRATAHQVTHACTARLPSSLFVRLEEGVCLSSPAFAFAQVASREKSMVSLLELGYELCGSYQTERTATVSAYQVEPLASVRLLRDFASRNPTLNGSRKISRIVRYLADGSASPRETKQALMFGLPHLYGGYGLGIPCMNYEVAATRPARAISGRRSFRCDLCWPDVKLDVEYQSREMHEGEASRIRDSRRANALAAMGWTVVSVTNDELNSMAATDTIALTLSRHVGKRPRVRVSDYRARKLKLRCQLGLPAFGG